MRVCWGDVCRMPGAGDCMGSSLLRDGGASASASADETCAGADAGDNEMAGIGCPLTGPGSESISGPTAIPCAVSASNAFFPVPLCHCHYAVTDKPGPAMELPTNF
jgi:hypothetical protein